MNTDDQSTAAVQALAAVCRGTLDDVARSPVVLRDVERQHKRMVDATVPLLSLGSECDLDALWGVVANLDSRLTGLPFSGDDPEDVGRLEASLDEVSVWIIDCLREEIRDRYGGAVSLSRGLVEGYWVIYAVVPPGVRLAVPSLLGQVPGETRQMSLWEM